MNMANKYLNIGDRVKMIVDSVKLKEKDRMILAGAIAFHLQDYSEQEIVSFCADKDEQWSEEHNKIKDAIFSKLHEMIGLCGHCGERICAGKKSNSYLPALISTDNIIAAIDLALSKLDGGS